MKCKKHNTTFTIVDTVAIDTDNQRNIIGCEKCYANRKRTKIFVPESLISPEWMQRYKKSEKRIVARYGVR